MKKSKKDNDYSPNTIQIEEFQAEELTPREMADAIAGLAVSQKKREGNKSIALEAIECSADSVDAWLLLAESAFHTSKRKILCIRIALETAIHNLGNKVTELKGVLWMYPDGRRLVLCRAALAETLWEFGERSEAIEQAFCGLKEDENDCMGFRFILMGWLLAEKMFDHARRLITKHDDEHCSHLAWARVILEVETGDSHSQKKALEKALEVNQKVAEFVVGERKVKKKKIDQYIVGSLEEAQATYQDLAEAFSKSQRTVDFVTLNCIGKSRSLFQLV